MKRQMRKAVERVLSILLSVVMIVGMIPVSALAGSPANPNDLTITVTEAGQAVTDAQVAYTIKVNDVEQKTGSVTTADGIAVITDMAAYAEKISGGTDTVKIKYTVTKEGYKEVSNEVTVMEANANFDVTMEKEETPAPVTEKVKINVESSGSGKIKLNGTEIVNGGVLEVEKGSKVSMEVNAGGNAFIEKLEVNNTEDTAAKNKTTYSLPDGFTAESDMTIRATFAVFQHKVTAEAGDGGSITLKQGAKSSSQNITVDKGSSVNVTVKANKNYQILNVKIDGTEQADFVGKQSYEAEITVTKDVTVEATFVRVYKVTVKFDKEKGDVTMIPAGEGGTVTVQNGTKVVVTATPKENYHVSKVLKNNEEVKINIENGGKYEDRIVKVEKDYTYEITFAPDQYKITVQTETPEGGKVDWTNNPVDYNSEQSLNITQYPGYHLEAIKVNEAVQDLNDHLQKGTLSETGNGTYIYKLGKITKDVEVKVTFAINQKITPDWKQIGTGNENNYYDIKLVDTQGAEVSALKDYDNGTRYVLGKGVEVKIVPKSPYTRISYVTSTNEQSNPSEQITLSAPSGEDKSITISKIIVGKGQQGYFEPIEIMTGFSLEWDKSAPDVTMKTTVGTEGDNGYYTSDVTVTLDVKDSLDADAKDGTSGIAEIMYQITNGTEPVEENYISIDPEVFQKEIKDSYTKNILVDAKDHNSGDVRIYVKATDRAGNTYVTTEPYKLKICTTPPEIAVSIDGEKDSKADETYYNKKRTATVTFTDREDVFAEEAATAAISIKKDGQIQPNMVSWRDTHTAIIEFNDDGRYEWSIGKYSNRAGVENVMEATVEGDSVYSFTIDTRAPITSNTPDKDNASWIGFEDTAWSKLVTTLTFNIFKKHEVRVVAQGIDETSGMKEILYYKETDEKEFENASNKTMEEMEAYLDGCTFQKDSYTVSTDEKFVVYARLTDKAGNTAYIGTNGIIVDMTMPLITLTAPASKPGESAAAPNDEGYYTNDVMIGVTVQDPTKQNVASGIKKVEYSISSEKLGKTEEKGTAVKGTLYEFNENAPQNGEPLHMWNSDGEGKPHIIVKASEFDTDDIVVNAKVTDNAGNVSDAEPVKFKISNVDPEVSVDFSDECQGYDMTEEKVINRAYFNKEWSVTVKVNKDRDDTFVDNIMINPTEDEKRNGFSINVTATNAEGKSVLEENSIRTEWLRDEKSVKITFNDDANYTWSLSYTNRAGRTAKQISYDAKKKFAPWDITVDKTKPTGKIKISGKKGEEDVIGVWEKIRQVLSFGYFSNQTATVSLSGNDETSKVTMKYLRNNTSELLSADDLDSLDKAGKLEVVESEKFEIEKSEQVVIYLKVTDSAGNYTYINSDGYIVDKEPSKIDFFDIDKEYKAEGNIFDATYNRDVRVGIHVMDPNASKEEGLKYYSGIKTITYEVKNDTAITQTGTLYNFTETSPKRDDLKEEWKSTKEDPASYILVDAEKNNSSKVEVKVTVTDNAGNKSSQICFLDIDITEPEISVEYLKDKGNKEVLPTNIVKEKGFDRGYFNRMRMASVTIKERTAHFDEEAAKAGIVIKATDSKGKKIAYNTTTMYGDWTTTEGRTPDDATHTILIWYYTDANYDVSISYTDKAGNKNKGIDYGSAPTPEHFTVDQEGPTGTITTSILEGSLKKNKVLSERVSDELASSLSFGSWAKDMIAVTGEIEDKTSKETTIEYYKVSGEQDTQSLLTKTDLDNVKTWTSLDKDANRVQVGGQKRVGFTVDKDEKFIVYMKLTDLAKNVTYISSNGMIVDKHKPKVENVAPNVTITPEPTNGIYNKDVRVSIKVVDPEYGEAYSGLKTVKYRVENMGKITQEGVLYSADQDKSLRNKCKKTWSGSIIVKSKLNNSNDVTVRVYAEDNAGNISDFKNRNNKKTLKIDTTSPQISISYNNNSADSGKYYSSDRVATITVTERNFKAKDVITTIKNSDGSIPSISGWKEVKGTGNGDNTKYIATLTYHADGDYTFGINYTDLADNRCPGASYAAGTTNPTEFTIDQTAPVVTVSYDNNDAQNGKYFKEKRTATVTITEHNFDESRVEFSQTASLRGGSVSAPQASWSNNGDTHTATFVYDADGDYTFNVTMADMAGNKSAEASYGNSVAGREFTVDTEISKPQIEGVENGKSYKGDVVPSISYSDVNFAEKEIKLLRTRRDEKNVDVTEKYITGLKEGGDGASGINDTFKKIEENDGIYTLYVKITDLAGNEEAEEVTFTVNRFGSVYVFDEYLISLKDAYKQAIEKKLVITEYNPDKLKEDSLDIQITRDGTPLNNVKYTVSPAMNDKVEVGESGWYQYEYEIDAENFKEDGIYKLIIASEDIAGNKPETTNFEDGDVLFHVDSTPPEITNIVGMEKAVVNAESQNVSFDVFDAIGLKQITVYVDGVEAGLYNQFEDLVNYSGEIMLREGANQKVSLKVEDLAGNIIDTNEKNEEGNYIFQPEFSFVRDITISTNVFIRWYANKMLFWGSIGTAAAAAVALFLILFLKRRKKEEG